MAYKYKPSTFYKQHCIKGRHMTTETNNLYGLFNVSQHQGYYSSNGKQVTILLKSWLVIIIDTHSDIGRRKKLIEI